MSRLGVWLVELINRLVPPLEMHRELSQDKLSIEGYQARERQEVQRLVPEFGPRWQVSGQRLLDVGAGLGGKPAFYVDQGAKVTAIDIRLPSLRSASALARQRPAGRLELVQSDAAVMPFGADSFDVIVSINTLEHVADLFSTLAECRRVLRPGGLMFFHFPPFYSPWGPHLEGWINFPWPHLFFSDRTLIDAARRVEARNRLNADYIPSAQVDWDRLERLPDLNRATAAQVFDYFSRLGLGVLEAHMLPFGRDYLARRGPLGRMALGVLRALARLPLLREVITTKMVFVLTKGQVSLG